MPVISQAFHSIIHTLKHVFGHYFGNILSGRGYILLAFVTYLFLGPVSYDTDIVSSYIAYGLFGTLITALLVAIGIGFYVRRAIKVSLFLPEGDLISGTPQIIVVKTSRIRVPAFFHLDIEFILDRDGSDLPVFKITGSGLSERTVSATTKFPHRGIWNIQSIRFSFGDQAGITRFRWLVAHEDRIRVSPPREWDGVLPIISSSQRPGDAATDITNRQGDYFDIKQYHPTDGVRKILWKVFAKRGELLSRHPEPSMTPEGQVILFALAEKNEDEVCTRFLSYLDQLEELSLTLIIGCQGMQMMPPISSKDGAETMLIETAWQSSINAINQSCEELMRLISGCKNKHPDIRIDRVILFASPSNPRLAALSAAIGEALERESISPVFFLSSGDRPIAPQASLWKKLLTSEAVLEQTDPKIYGAFLQTCLARSWEVVL